MSATEAVAIDETENGHSERKWRRRSLWALAILMPAAFVVMSYRPIMLLLNTKDLIARDVKPGSATRFGGSDWRLEAMLTISDTGSAQLPDNAVPIFVDYMVTIVDPDLERLWTDCRIRLVDAHGRSWFPSSISIFPPSDDRTNCGSAIFSKASTGDTLKIRETFIVPKDAIATIQATLSLGSERPYYLRFLRPSS